jgi:hypothetical protein
MELEAKVKGCGNASTATPTCFTAASACSSLLPFHSTSLFRSNFPQLYLPVPLYLPLYLPLYSKAKGPPNRRIAARTFSGSRPPIATSGKPSAQPMAIGTLASPGARQTRQS